MAEEAIHASGIGLKMIPKSVGAPSADVSSDDAFIARRAKAAMDAPAPQRQLWKPSGFSLMEMSTALQSGPDFTLVPKGSVIFCPRRFEQNVVKKPSGKIAEWPHFMRLNRSWITTFEVTQDQVTGKTAIPPETWERFEKSNLVVLATLQGGPVTVIKHTLP